MCHPDRRHFAKGQCRPCYANDPVSKRRALLATYGLTVTAFDAMVATQGGRCAICRRVPDERLHIDHDHETGAIRGLLCASCNRGLGLLGDDEARLEAALAYMRDAWLRAVRSA